MRGLWSLPGGALELGERLVDGLRREIREEVGLEVNVIDVVEVFDRVIRDEAGEVRYHYVLIDYLCEPTGGSLRAGSDADEAAWVERAGVAERETTEGAAPVIEKAFDLRERLAARA
jgi:ADP-ribose pyrophosphatase YjhB (NUDIX family)